MKQYTVYPLSGFDDVKFGMTRTEVRDILGSPERELKKSKLSKVTTDDYNLFHIFYDNNDRFEAVEFFDKVEIIIDGRIIFPKSMENLMKLPYNFVPEEAGAISVEYSIGIYAPDKMVESILFGVKGYY